MMKGTLHLTSSADFPKAVVMENGKVLLMRNDGGPNRVVADVKAARDLVGDLQPYGDRKGRRNDDAWEGEQRFTAATWADIEARSAAAYDRPPAPPTAAASSSTAAPSSSRKAGKSRSKRAAAGT